ncbi:MAG: recombinase family protein [Elainellaceae cyanobacterium]
MIYAYVFYPSAEAVDPYDWPQPVDRIYQDIGAHHQLLQLCQDCRHDPQAVDVIMVRRLADLGESLQEVSDRLAELSQLGISVQAVAGSGPSASAPDDLELAQTIDRQQRQRRIRQGHAKARIQGQPPPGKAPYGYRRARDRYNLDRSAAAVVRAFFDHFLLYGSLRQSVRHLTEAHNKTISVSTGKRWLSSSVYRGDLAYQNGDVISDTHTPILSRDEAAQIDRLVRRNRQFAPRTRTAPRSLAGLVQCGRCQMPMVVGKTTRKRGRQRVKDYLYLRPSRCPYREQSRDGTSNIRCVSIPYADVLDKTITRVCTDLPRTVSQAAPPPVAAIQQGLTHQIETKQAILNQLNDLQDQGVLDQQTATLRAYTLQTEIATLRDQLGKLPPASLFSIAQTVSIPQFWLDLSETERRFYFREFIQHIQLTQDGQSWDITLAYRF